MIIALILGFILGAAALTFILQNTAVVALTFLSYQFTASIALVVLLSLLLGILLTLIVTLPSAIGTAWRMRKLEKHATKMQQTAEENRIAAETAHARLAQNQADTQAKVLDLS